jgi:DNA-binding NtrC family response regulator
MKNSETKSGKQCVLIVEAEVLIRQPLAEYLRECGYFVVEAVNDEEARQFLTEGVVEVDVVLSDVDIPGGGFALKSWAREHCPDTHVILAGTVVSAAEKAGDLCEEGPTLKKPYEHKFVLDRIRRLLAARDRAE